MSLNAGQIFVHDQEIDDVVEFVRNYLGEWYKEVFLSLGQDASPSERAELFLDEESVRSVVVLPPVDGWICILERCQERVDGDMVRSMSKELDCRVLWSEVLGKAYARWFADFEGGELQAHLMEPVGYFRPYYREFAGEENDVDRSTMPMYSDSEHIGYEYLIDIGIPRDLVFLRHDDVYYSPQEEQQQAAFFKIWNRDDGPAYHHYTFPAEYESPRDGQVPVRFDAAELKIETSQQLITETRYLYGEPTREVVERIMEIEIAFRERAFRYMLSKCEEDYLPEMDFRYVVEGDVANAFRRFARTCRAERKAKKRYLYSSHLLSKVGFVKRAMESILREFPGTKAAETPPLGLRLHGFQDPRSTIVILSEAYHRYVERPDELDNIVRESVAKALRPGSGPSKQA